MLQDSVRLLLPLEFDDCRILGCVSVTIFIPNSRDIHHVWQHDRCEKTKISVIFRSIFSQKTWRKQMIPPPRPDEVRGFNTWVPDLQKSKIKIIFFSDYKHFRLKPLDWKARYHRPGFKFSWFCYLCYLALFLFVSKLRDFLASKVRFL